MVDMDVVVVQFLQTGEDATYSFHSQILSDAEDKAAFPPSVEEVDAVVAGHPSHNKTGHAMQPQCILISSIVMQTRMYAFLAGLT